MLIPAIKSGGGYGRCLHQSDRHRRPAVRRSSDVFEIPGLAAARKDDAGDYWQIGGAGANRSPLLVPASGILPEARRILSTGAVSRHAGADAFLRAERAGAGDAGA